MLYAKRLRSAIVRAAVLFFLLGGGSQASAARFDFKVLHAGRPVPGAEICFFTMSVQEPALINRLFHGEDVQCLPADMVLEIPHGNWLYFVRHASGLISDLPLRVSMAPAAPEEAFKVIHEDVVPAGVVGVAALRQSLRSDERLALLTESPGTGTVVFPLVPDETTFLVPGGARFVIAIIAGHRPTRLSPVMQVAAGKTAEVRPWPDQTSVHDVVASIVFPPLLYETFGEETVTGLEPPDVALEVGERRFPPLFRIESTAIGRTLLLFKDIPRATGTIRLGGRYWTSDSLPSDATAPVEVVEDPLTTQPAGAASATIHLPPPHSRIACHSDEEHPTASILACPSEGAQNCTTVQTAAVGETGDVEIGGLPPGRYQFVFDAAAGGGRVRRPLLVEVGTTTRLMIEPDYHSFYGTVFLGDQPVSRALSFSGRGSAVSDPDGRFAVTLSGASSLPAASVIRVTDCEDEDAEPYLHVTRSAPKSGERFDIVIPVNLARVSLIARESGRKIAGSVTLVSYQDEAPDVTHFAGRYPVPDGEVSIPHIATSTEIALCGEADGYERQCMPRFRIGVSERKNVAIELTKARRLHGRIIAPAPIELGRFWIANDLGALIEYGIVEPNGRFTYKSPHGAGEHVVLTSALPLAVMPWPIVETGGTVELRYPSARSRALSVRTAGAPPLAFSVGLSIGDSLIPTEAFAYHQDLRAASYIVKAAEPLAINDLLESAPISVILGPDRQTIAAQFAPDVDWMAVIPYVRSRPRGRPDPAGVVAFDP